MKLEYLIRNKEQLEFANGLVFDDVEISLREIPNKEMKILSLDIKGENEASAKILSKHHVVMMARMPLTILNNESSKYFVKALFPAVNDFEYNLRKLLFLGSSLILVNPIEQNFIETIEEQTLNSIFEFLFTDKTFNNKVREKVNYKDNGRVIQYSKKQYEEMISQLVEETFGSKLFGKRIPILNDKYLEIQNARNDVAHAHNINAETFNKHRNLFKTVNQQLEDEIHRFENPLTPLQDLKNFNELLGNALMRFVESTKIDNSFFAEIARVRDEFNSSPLMKMANELAYITQGNGLSEIARTAKEAGERLNGVFPKVDIGVMYPDFGVQISSPIDEHKENPKELSQVSLGEVPDSLSLESEDDK